MESVLRIGDGSRGPVGATIETPKGSRTIKLSTIWVVPPFRKMGVGHALIDACCARWVANGIANAYVTTDTRRSEVLFPVLKRFGFERGPIEHQRYGTDRSEAVSSSGPAQSSISLPGSMPMGFFALMRDPAGPNFQVVDCHLNLWCLKGLFGPTLLWDMGLAISFTEQGGTLDKFQVAAVWDGGGRTARPTREHEGPNHL